MSAAKPPGGYRFGANSDAVVLVPARIAAWLTANTGLSKVRVTARGTDPELYAVLHDLYVAALEWRASVTGSTSPPEPEATALSKWMTTTEVAGQLNITDRAVRLAIAEGRLKAEQTEGRWRIARENFEHYRQAREARRRRSA